MIDLYKVRFIVSDLSSLPMLPPLIGNEVRTIFMKLSPLLIEELDSFIDQGFLDHREELSLDEIPLEVLLDDNTSSDLFFRSLNPFS